MDFRIVLAIASSAAAIALAAVGVASLWRGRIPPALFWVYGLLFVGVALVLWRGRAVRVTSAPPEVRIAESLTMLEPADNVVVQPVPTAPVARSAPRKANLVQPQSASPEAAVMAPEWQLYHAISGAFDSIEQYFYRNGTPVITSDSVPALRIEVSGTVRTHAENTPVRRRKASL